MIGGWGIGAVLLGLLAPGGETGSIVGTVDKPGGATAVFAIHRETGKKYPGTIDGPAGQFAIEGLPAGSRYDCVVDFGTARLEGIDLTVPATDEDGEEAGPLEAEDVKTLQETARSLNKFEDVVKILDIRGNARHAVVLVDKLRTQPFVNSKPGEVIWRTELWHFERPDETWVKVQDELFIILYRERLMKADFDAKSVTFDPALGGVAVGPGKRADVGRVTPPDPKPGVRLKGGVK